MKGHGRWRWTPDKGPLLDRKWGSLYGGREKPTRKVEARLLAQSNKGQEE